MSTLQSGLHCLYINPGWLEQTLEYITRRIPSAKRHKKKLHLSILHSLDQFHKSYCKYYLLKMWTVVSYQYSLIIQIIFPLKRFIDENDDNCFSMWPYMSLLDHTINLLQLITHKLCYFPQCYIPQSSASNDDNNPTVIMSTINCFHQDLLTL